MARPRDLFGRSGLKARPPLRGGLLSDLVQRAHHCGALVLDIIQPRRLGDLPRLGGADVELQPKRPGARSDRLARDLGRVLRRPEDVDEVDLERHLAQRAVDALTEQFAGEWVDRDDPKASSLEAKWHRATGLVGITRGADHGDSGRPLEDLVGAACHQKSETREASSYSRRIEPHVWRHPFASRLPE